MRTLLLGFSAALAASAVPVFPASAEGHSASRADRGNIAVHRGGEFRRDRDGRFDRRRRDRVDQAVLLDFGRGYYDDRFAGRSWEPESYNDWWHERPERSYPRWMQNNRNCERQWWSGGGWTC